MYILKWKNNDLLQGNHTPMSDQAEFLLTILIKYQPDKWWE